MSKKKIVYIAIFAVITISCLWAFVASSVITRNFKKELFNEANLKERANIKELIVIETRDGKKYWELYAQKGYYSGSAKVASLEDIIGNFYRDDEVTLSFKAKEAEFDEETKQINLTKEAIIIYKDGTYIKADDFEWTGKENDIVAKGNIKIEKPGAAITYGDKAVLSNEMTNFEISGNTKTELYGGRNLK